MKRSKSRFCNILQISSLLEAFTASIILRRSLAENNRDGVWLAAGDFGHFFIPIREL